MKKFFCAVAMAVAAMSFSACCFDDAVGGTQGGNQPTGPQSYAEESVINQVMQAIANGQGNVQNALPQGSTLVTPNDPNFDAIREALNTDATASSKIYTFGKNVKVSMPNQTQAGTTEVTLPQNMLIINDYNNDGTPDNATLVTFREGADFADFYAIEKAALAKAQEMKFVPARLAFMSNLSNMYTGLENMGKREQDIAKLQAKGDALEEIRDEVYAISSDRTASLNADLFANVIKGNTTYTKTRLNVDYSPVVPN